MMTTHNGDLEMMIGRLLYSHVTCVLLYDDDPDNLYYYCESCCEVLARTVTLCTLKIRKGTRAARVARDVDAAHPCMSNDDEERMFSSTL